MILIITGFLMIVVGCVIYYILFDYNDEYRFKGVIKKIKDKVRKAIKSVCEVFIIIRNFFGRIFKSAGR